MKKANFSTVKPVLPYLGGIVLVLLLFYFIASFLIRELNKQIVAVDEAKKTENTLMQKKTTLENISPMVLENSEKAAIFLPTSNPALVLISQVKSLVSESGLPLFEISSSSPLEKEDEPSHVTVSFEVDGPVFSILQLVQKLKTIAPLVTVNRVNVSGTQGTSSATVEVKGHWAPLLEKISSVDEPLSTLTSEEQELLDIFGILRLPNFTDGVAAPQVIREDPFN